MGDETPTLTPSSPECMTKAFFARDTEGFAISKILLFFLFGSPRPFCVIDKQPVSLILLELSYDLTVMTEFCLFCKLYECVHRPCKSFYTMCKKTSKIYSTLDRLETCKRTHFFDICETYFHSIILPYPSQSCGHGICYCDCIWWG